MTPIDFFTSPQTVSQKQYEALRMYFVEKKKAKEVATHFGYTYRGFTTIISEFKTKLKNKEADKPLFFVQAQKGRKKKAPEHEQLVVDLRKKYYSVEDIKAVLDAKQINLSEKTIYNILHAHGFSRLPRRQKWVKQHLEKPAVQAEKSCAIANENQTFKSTDAGILALLPYLKKLGIDALIEQSNYPGTKQISTLSSILSFVALKASNVRRYSADDTWCMDRGLGLFAGLNVLPKAAWFSQYSHGVTREMNVKFLKSLHQKWQSLGLLSDTANLDFTTIPYWGEADHLENNWSGKRSKALDSMLAVVAQDPDSGIIDYGDTDVMHKNEPKVALEFLDFYSSAGTQKNTLKYLVFDSKFTTYENLSKIDDQQIKFITIRKRGKNMMERLQATPKNEWKKIRVERAGNKKATLQVLDEKVLLKGYGKEIRQVSIHWSRQNQTCSDHHQRF